MVFLVILDISNCKIYRQYSSDFNKFGKYVILMCLSHYAKNWIMQSQYIRSYHQKLGQNYEAHYALKKTQKNIWKQLIFLRINLF